MAFTQPSIHALLRLAGLLFLALTFAHQVLAEQKQTFGDYEVHYNTLTTDFLEASVSKQYNIPRSEELGFIIVSLLKVKDDGMLEGKQANVKGSFRNLIGQKKQLEFMEIIESNAVYYISTYEFDNKFNYHFEINVNPKTSTQNFFVKFEKKLEYNH